VLGIDTNPAGRVEELQQARGHQRVGEEAHRVPRPRTIHARIIHVNMGIAPIKMDETHLNVGMLAK
jgi:hypothetical protein